MLLLTMREHFFMGRQGQGWETHREKTLAFSTDLPLLEALKRVKTYEQEYRSRYGRNAVVEFNLLAVSEVLGNATEERTAKIMQDAMVQTVESLPQKPEDFES